MVIKIRFDLSNGIRTRIVMVYQSFKIRLNGNLICIRTRIVMVYRTAKSRTRKPGLVFVQELLWFIVPILSNRYYLTEYSYKNCYGLSYQIDMLLLIMNVFVQELLWFI